MTPSTRLTRRADRADASRAPRVAVISGVAAAIAPAASALRDAMPGAVLWNLLDDRLIDEAIRLEGVSSGLAARMDRLLDHAADGGADAVLITCSLYSYVASGAAARLGIPVLGPDDAMLVDVARQAFGSIAIVSSVAIALADSTARARAYFAGIGADVTVHPVLVPEARRPSLALDAAETAAAIRSALSGQVGEVGAIVLANYTLSIAAPLLQVALPVPILCGPAPAASAIQSCLDQHRLSSAAHSSHQQKDV